MKAIKKVKNVCWKATKKVVNGMLDHPVGCFIAGALCTTTLGMIVVAKNQERKIQSYNEFANNCVDSYKKGEADGIESMASSVSAYLSGTGKTNEEGAKIVNDLKETCMKTRFIEENE